MGEVEPLTQVSLAPEHSLWNWMSQPTLGYQLAALVALLWKPVKPEFSLLWLCSFQTPRIWMLFLLGKRSELVESCVQHSYWLEHYMLLCLPMKFTPVPVSLQRGQQPLPTCGMRTQAPSVLREAPPYMEFLVFPALQGISPGSPWGLLLLSRMETHSWEASQAASIFLAWRLFSRLRFGEEVGISGRVRQRLIDFCSRNGGGGYSYSQKPQLDSCDYTVAYCDILFWESAKTLNVRRVKTWESPGTCRLARANSWQSVLRSEQQRPCSPCRVFSVSHNNHASTFLKNSSHCHSYTPNVCLRR